MNTRQLVLLAFLTEMFLVLLWFCFVYVFKLLEHSQDWSFALEDFYSLLISLLILTGFNYGILKLYKHQELEEFYSDKVQPLCRLLPLPAALFVSILAGFGEELFFRGFVYNYADQFVPESLAIIISGLLFAYVHFLGQVRDYPRVFAIYTLVGIYLGLVYSLTQSLLVVILLHSIYDFLAIAYIRCFEVPEKEEPELF